MIFQNKADLLAVLHEIMAEMFFMFPDLDDDGLPMQFLESFNADYLTNINYGSDYFLFFEWNRNMLYSMVANFLGTNPGKVSEGQLLSMAKEATNVVAGRYLVLNDPDKACSLSLPQLLQEEDAEAIMAVSPMLQVGFVSDGQAMRVSAYYVKKHT